MATKLVPELQLVATNTPKKAHETPVPRAAVIRQTEFEVGYLIHPTGLTRDVLPFLARQVRDKLRIIQKDLPQIFNLR